jgi:Ca-activated chloride channel family protein
VGLISFSGVVTTEVAPTLDRAALDRGIEGLELAESTAIGDALVSGTRLLTNLAEDSDGDEDTEDEDIAPGAMVLLSDGETTVGRDTAEGAAVAAEANIPVFTIAFGTADGSITDPVSNETIPVPVQPGPLEDVAETTGGAAYEAATGTELADAYDRIQDTLGDTLGEEVETVTELTWRWAAIALAILAAAWALGLWWLRGMV